MKVETFYFVKGEKIPEAVVMEKLGKHICSACFSTTIADPTYGDIYCTNDECNKATRILGRIKRENINKVFEGGK